MLNNNCKANYYYYFCSVRPNIFVGRVEGSAVYQKWYFEVTLDHMEQTTHMTPHLRIGWANTAGLDTVFFVFFNCLQFPHLLIFLLLHFSVMFLILEVEKNGVEMVLVMICIRMDLMELLYGPVNIYLSFNCKLVLYNNSTLICPPLVLDETVKHLGKYGLHCLNK